MESGLEGKSNLVVEERSSPRVELEEWMKLGSEVERRVVKIGELAVKPEKAIPAMTGIVRNVGSPWMVGVLLERNETSICRIDYQVNQ